MSYFSYVYFYLIVFLVVPFILLHYLQIGDKAQMMKGMGRINHL